MYQPINVQDFYNSMSSQNSIHNCYGNIAIGIKRIFTWGEQIPVLYRFALNNLNVKPNMGIHVPTISELDKEQWGYSEKFKIMTDTQKQVDVFGFTKGDSCTFTQVDLEFGDLKQRVCGSNILQLGRSDVISRSFRGGIYQLDVLVKNYCCDGGMTIEALRESVVESFIKKMTRLVFQSILNAIFAPVIQRSTKSATGTEVLTLIEDTDGREIDLSANPLTYGNLLEKLAKINDVEMPAVHYYWFVPAEFYAKLVALPAYSNNGCCWLVNKYDDYLKISSYSKITIVGLNKDYFPIVGGKVVTPVLPVHSVAFNLIKPSPAMGVVANAVNVMSYGRQLHEFRGGASLGEEYITMLEDLSSSGLNWNGVITLMFGLVAGRLRDENMWRILLNTSPTLSEQAIVQPQAETVTLAIGK